jgi:hypothetical protein
MSQEDSVKKATLRAYLTSGAILVLSLLVFFFFHKQQDDKAQEHIGSLQSQLADSKKSQEQLKQSASESQKSLPELQSQLDALKLSYDEYIKTSKDFQKQYSELVNTDCYEEISNGNDACFSKAKAVSELSVELEKKTSDTTTKFKIPDGNLRTKTAQSKPPAPSAAPPQTLAQPPKVERQEVEVYITRTGSTYHRDGCQYLSRSQIPISKKAAIAQGYDACSRCNP